MASTVAFVVVVLLVAASHCYGLNPVKARDCGSKTGKFTDVSVSAEISPAGVVELVKETNVTFQVVFTVNEDVTKATAKVHGLLGPVPVPFPLDNPDGCKNNLPCPLKKGGTYTYKSVIYVRELYPKIKLLVEWALEDQDSNNIWCLVVPAVIQDPKNNH